MGATLQASKTKYKLYSPSSHSLPLIRCPGTESNHAEILLFQRESGLGRLSLLSPLFGKMWNDGSGPLGVDYESLARKVNQSTFQIVSRA